MSKHLPRIVFMGTPAFAVAPLNTLLDSGCNVVGVITAPDRPAGRGKKIRRSAVKEYLLQKQINIPLLQPENLKEPAFLMELAALKPDLQVVVAFRMLPEAVWSLPPLGTFNLHASLLPQYRGAAPINHVLINGERETGVTTFFIDDRIDTGKILLQRKTTIGENETAGELHDRLMELGAQLVLDTVLQVSGGQVEAKAQDHQTDRDLKKAPKIFKEDCRINWNLPGKDLFNLIRGLSPSPGAYTILKQEDGDGPLFKIFFSSFDATPNQYTPGTISTDGKRVMKVALVNGWLHIHSLQQEGKRKMDVKDFLAGFNLTNGESRFS
jgi:methionyl-tRNA formyltransferase